MFPESHISVIRQFDLDPRVHTGDMRGMGKGRAAALLLLGVLLVLVARPAPASSERSPGMTRALFFGDSLINGTGSSPAGPWEVRTAARELGWQATVDGFGGTGYTTGGKRGKPYLTRLAKDGALHVPYDVIVLEGGTNDARHGSLSKLRAKALQVVDYVHARQPWARIVMVGGFAPYGIDQTRYVQMDAVLAEVASLRKVQYVSQLHYGTLATGFLSADDYHPGNAGYHQMGHDLAVALGG
jgi:lysophospholipase L1-like esterase